MLIGPLMVINVFKIILLVNSVIFCFRFTLAKYYQRDTELKRTHYKILGPCYNEYFNS